MPSPTSYPVRLLVFFSLCIGFLVIGFARTPSAATSALKLQYRTGDVSPTNSDIKPDLQIVNTSTVAIPLNELTIRYWYTRDTDQSQHYTCDYAVLDCATIIATFGTVNPPVTGADHYLEIGFASTAGLLSGGSGTGIIQGRITKADWSDFDETDDYSYNAVQNSLADATTVTLYRNGRLVWGEEPGGVSTRALKLQYRAGDANPVNSDIKPELLIVNIGIREVALSDLTLRYWYTAGSNQPQYFWCDYAEVGCANVTGTFGSATPAVPGADTYLEIGFTDTAGYLPGGGGSGVIKSRITNADWRDFDETDDYSYHAEQTSLTDWSRVTLYVNDVLIWGIEPGQCTGPYPAPECLNTTATPTPTPTHTAIPSPTPKPLNGFVQVSAGLLHSCGLRIDGKVICWGRNEEGQSAPPDDTFTQISAGGFNTCGVKSDNTIVCWGWDGAGGFVPPEGNFTQVSTGLRHTCGLRVDGTVTCWGIKFSESIVPSSGTFTDISSGMFHTCGVKTDGILACWGKTDSALLAPFNSTFVQVSASKGIQSLHTCGLRTDNTVVCWGGNNVSQFVLPSGTSNQISAGGEINCALNMEGALVCWKSNGKGQLNPPDGTFTQVSVGGEHACAIKTDSTLVCWGDNDSGQISIPTVLSDVELNPESILSSSENVKSLEILAGTPESQILVTKSRVFLPIIQREKVQIDPPLPSPTSIPGAPTLPDPPDYTRSYYIQYDDEDEACALGAFSRNVGDQGIAILAFGTPRNLGSASNPIYGVRLLQEDSGVIGPEITFNRAMELASNFAIGYMNGCGDLYPLNEDPVTPSLIVIPGTNNAKIDINGELRDNPYLLITGSEWAQSVDKFRTFLQNMEFSPRVRAGGGFDAERPDLLDQWSSPVYSIIWATDFDAENLTLRYYFYGDANGVPRLETKADWTDAQKDALREVYQVAMTPLLSYPVPQIYHWPYAQEWYNVRRYAQEELNEEIQIFGIMTSCLTLPASICNAGTDTRHWQERSPGDFLTPDQAWEAMYQIHNAPRSPGNEDVTLRPLSAPERITDMIYQPEFLP